MSTENTDKTWEPKIVAFLCNWCSYAGADLAGVSRLQYPPNVRVIRVPCSGRINPLYILKALQSGMDGVLVSGCHPGDCHYISGNLVARRKFALLKSFLDYLGFEPERVQFSWVSASEGGRFASLIQKVTDDVKKIGPAPAPDDSVESPGTPASDTAAAQAGPATETVEAEVREAAKKLLSEKKVDMVIGYENGSLPGRTRPCFARQADDTDRLVWNSNCTNNLAVYLPKLFEKPAHSRQEFVPPTVGIVAKACDMRSVIGLVKEKQVPRDKLVIIGIPCPGMTEPDTAELMESCSECAVTTTEGADVTIAGEARPASESLFLKVEALEAMTPEERRQYFRRETSKCIRCYACRQACPNCYCKSCFAEQTKPRWLGPGTDNEDLMFYQAGRILHQAGRCVGCDACVRACPAGIDLRPFTMKISKEVKDTFGFEPGMSEEELPPLCTFREDDSESFITEP